MSITFFAPSIGVCNVDEELKRVLTGSNMCECPEVAPLLLSLPLEGISVRVQNIMSYDLNATQKRDSRGLEGVLMACIAGGYVPVGDGHKFVLVR
jgi:hypothetical protein